jgi:hypothetical protein
MAPLMPQRALFPSLLASKETASAAQAVKKFCLEVFIICCRHGTQILNFLRQLINSYNFG